MGRLATAPAPRRVIYRQAPGVTADEATGVLVRVYADILRAARRVAERESGQTAAGQGG